MSKMKHYTVILLYENGDDAADRFIAHTSSDSICSAVDSARRQMAAINEVDATRYADAPVIAVFNGWLEDVYDGSCD